MAAVTAAATNLMAPPARAAETDGEAIGSQEAVTLSSLPASDESEPEEQDPQLSQEILIMDEAEIYEQGTGFYATIGIGATWPNNVDGRVRRRDLPNRSIELKTQAGLALDAGIGYDFGAIRTELTYIYNRISVDDVKRGRNWNSTSTNSGNQNGIMASAYWDIDTGSRWTPYIGGGVGWINQSMGRNRLVRVRNDGSLNRINTGRGSDDLFGWQAKAGVAYGLNWNTDVYAEAVYQGAESFRAGRTSYDGFNNNWGFKIGARYRFGGPRVEVQEDVVITPEPAPAPAPAPRPQPEPMFQPEPAPIRGLW